MSLGVQMRSIFKLLYEFYSLVVNTPYQVKQSLPTLGSIDLIQFDSVIPLNYAEILRKCLSKNFYQLYIIQGHPPQGKMLMTFCKSQVHQVVELKKNRIINMINYFVKDLRELN